MKTKCCYSVVVFPVSFIAGVSIIINDRKKKINPTISAICMVLVPFRKNNPATHSPKKIKLSI